MKEKKKIEILLKVIERVYNKNPGMFVTRIGTFFFAFLCHWLYGLSKQKFIVCDGPTTYENIGVHF